MSISDARLAELAYCYEMWSRSGNKHSWQVSAEIDAAAALRELLTMRRRNALNAKFRDRPPLPGHELDFVVPAED